MKSTFDVLPYDDMAIGPVFAVCRILIRSRKTPLGYLPIGLVLTALASHGRKRRKK